MIKINLATRKQPLLSAGKTGGSGAFSLGALSGGGSSILGSSAQIKDAFNDFPWQRIVVPVLAAIFCAYGEEYMKGTEISALDSQIAAVNQAKPALEAEIAKMKVAEETKKTLEADEQALRTKVDTIHKLVDGRNSTSKLLIDLSSNTPQDVWLSEFKVDADKVSILGYSAGFTQISDFMKALGESVFFADLNLKKTESVKDELGADVSSFELTARRK